MSKNTKKCSKKEENFDNDYIEPQTLHEFRVISVSFEFKRSFFFEGKRVRVCLQMLTIESSLIYVNEDNLEMVSIICSRKSFTYVFYLHSRHMREINQQVAVQLVKMKIFFLYAKQYREIN